MTDSHYSTGRSIAVAAEAIRQYLGDPRDWPPGAESALRGDLLFAAAEAVLDEAVASERLFARDYLDKVVGSYEERIRVGRQENDRQRERLAEGSKALAEERERVRQQSREINDLVNRAEGGEKALDLALAKLAEFEAVGQERERLIDLLRKSEEELTRKLAELQAETVSRREGYFKRVEELERETAELRSANERLAVRAQATADLPESDLAKARFDLAERLAVWLDTNPSNKGGAFERGFERAIDLLKDLGELPGVEEEEEARGDVARTAFELVEFERP